MFIGRRLPEHLLFLGCCWTLADTASHVGDHFAAVGILRNITLLGNRCHPNVHESETSQVKELDDLLSKFSRRTQQGLDIAYVRSRRLRLKILGRLRKRSDRKQQAVAFASREGREEANLRRRCRSYSSR